MCPITTKGFKCDVFGRTDCSHSLLSLIRISFLSFAVHNEKMTFGAFLTVNMPQKSRTVIPRKSRSVVKDYSQDAEKKGTIYKYFGELCKRVQSLKTLSGYAVNIFENRIEIKSYKESLLLPELEVVIDDSLGFTLKVYGFYLPDDHELYSQHFRSVTNTSVANLVKAIEFAME